MSIPLDRQHKINAQLAQSMGYQLKLTTGNLPDAHIITPGGERQPLSELPNFFTSADDNRALIEWLVAMPGCDFPTGYRQGFKIRADFIYLLNGHRDGYTDADMLSVMTASLEAKTLAAAAAMGMEVRESTTATETVQAGQAEDTLML